jgi:class 3 adenylate cyclase
MASGSIEGLRMPEHPVLRQVAEEMERFGRIAQMVDRTWRFVYISSEMWRAATGGEVLPEIYEMGQVRRELETRFAPNRPESQRAWWRANVPYMRNTLEPGTPEFANAFGPNADRAASIDPKPPPPVWGIESFFEEGYAHGGVQHLVAFRIDDYDGSFLGVLEVSWPAISGELTWLLAQGDRDMYERMAAMREPHRCPSALLFCDIEASGELSRRLSSKAYFELIRSVTTAIDRAVAEHDGIVGKHAGDGASAFFCARDHGDSESLACRAAIEAVHEVQKAARNLDAGGEAVEVNAGIHWGGTVVMGQVAEGGRLEITALGDEVNEAARIEAVARDGVALASKDVIERLEPADADAVGLALDAISYRTIASLSGAGEKAVRDAGAIPVTEV